MKIRTRLTLWYALMMLASLLLMGGVLHYELVGEFERNHPVEAPREKILDILEFYGLPTLIVLVVLGSWLIARALKPVDNLMKGVEGVDAGNLNARLALSGRGDELDRLAQSFNDMLGRVEAGTKSVRDFALHASHELKTPITILKAEAELALTDPSISSSERARLASQSEELERLSNLVHSLSLFAKADARLEVAAFESCDLSKLVRQATDDARVIALPRNVTVDLVHCDSVRLRADPAALRQVLLNLLENAIKHGGEGAWVKIALRAEGAVAILSVSNSGPAIPPELRNRLFQRFAHGPGPNAGAGLGLSLVKLLVEAHQGSVRFDSETIGVICVQVQLPIG